MSWCGNVLERVHSRPHQHNSTAQEPLLDFFFKVGQEAPSRLKHSRGIQVSLQSMVLDVRRRRTCRDFLRQDLHPAKPGGRLTKPARYRTPRGPRARRDKEARGLPAKAGRASLRQSRINLKTALIDKNKLSRRSTPQGLTVGKLQYASKKHSPKEMDEIERCLHTSLLHANPPLRLHSRCCSEPG